jgi:hypothetical protein
MMFKEIITHLKINDALQQKKYGGAEPQLIEGDSLG